MTEERIQEILRENKQRNERLRSPYDPIRGVGSLIPRFAFQTTEGTIYLPDVMREDRAISMLLDRVEGKCKIHELKAIRNLFDFEYWAAQQRIKNNDNIEVYFHLNKAQRKMTAKCERMRFAGQPIRMNILKARRLGGTTFAYTYGTYIQNIVRVQGANMRIVGLDSSNSANVLKLIDKLLGVPATYNRRTSKYRNLGPDGESKTTLRVLGTENTIALGTANNPEGGSGDTPQIILVTEIGKWKTTDIIKAEDTVTNLESMLTDEANTLGIREGTAKAQGGTYWKREVNLSRSRRSSYEFVFTSWLDDPDKCSDSRYIPQGDDFDTLGDGEFSWEWFISSMEDRNGYMTRDYEMELWGMGATLEQIAWYRRKARGYFGEHWRMQQEYPTTPDEAFQGDDARVFPAHFVRKARETCIPPRFIGNLKALGKMEENAFKFLHFEANPMGDLRVWRLPTEYPDFIDENSETITGLKPFERVDGVICLREGIKIENRYLTITDPAKGLSKKSSYGTSVVFDMLPTLFFRPPEVVAQWHGRNLITVFGWKQVQLAAWYDWSLWVCEVNLTFSMNTDAENQPESDGSQYLIDRIAKPYLTFGGKVYTSRSDVTRKDLGLDEWRYGFYTGKNRSTAIDLLMERLFENFEGMKGAVGYIERDDGACDEMDVFINNKGKDRAADNEFDDKVMTRAIGFFVMAQLGSTGENVSIREVNKTSMYTKKPSYHG